MKLLAAIKREQKKLEKQLGKLQASIERSASGCKSFGRFDEQKTQSRKEARDVRCGTGQNWQSYQEAVGEV
jgi:hypothetical protein